MLIEEKFNQKLLVEGEDDQHVMWALCEKFKIKENFDIIDCNGIDKLKNRILLDTKRSDIQTIGIIIDADTDLQGRWKSIKNILKNKFNLPETIPSNGLIHNNDEQKMGIWIMPNNNMDGMLEDFISFLVPDDDKLILVAEEVLQSIENKNLQKYSENHKSKAKIHTWLAWQENPGTPLGQSITKRYLYTDNELCQQFRQWLTDLFT